MSSGPEELLPGPAGLGSQETRGARSWSLSTRSSHSRSWASVPGVAAR
ncbi:hypothetical protein AB0M87_00885 [Streptomyces sp. NPDC051320]